MAWERLVDITLAPSASVLIEPSKYNYRVTNFSSTTNTIYARVEGHAQYEPVASLGATNSETPLGVGPFNYPAYLQFTATTGNAVLMRELKNTAPTTPGSFMSPSGELEIGDSKVVSWMVSSDAENNINQYILEVSINGGSWTHVMGTSNTGHAYTIPTATSLKFRVKARDSAGLESAYRESATFTVTKPKYYWSKYNNSTVDNGSWGLVETFQRTDSFNSHLIGSTIPGSWLDNTTYSISGNGVINLSGSKDELVAFGRTFVRYLFSGMTYYKRYYRLTDQGNPQYAGLFYDQYTITAKYTSNIVNVRGSLIQSDLIAVEGTYPTNGRHSDGYWYVRGSRVNSSIAPTGAFTSPTTGKVFKPGELTTVTFIASNAPNISLYEVDYKYGNGSWQTLANNASLSRTLTITTDKALGNVQFRVRAKNTSNVYSDYVYSEIYTIEHNTAPTVNLMKPSNNQTLYENDTYIIDGTVLETNVGDTVTVRYQIDAGTERAVKAYLSTGALESFGKQLTFKGGNLYDGATLIAENLIDGVAHTLKVWATDDKGGTSAIVERTFYVVPNRVPLLTVNTPVTEGNIDAELININGTFSDPDANNAVVSYRINGSNSIQIAEGVSGVFDFTVSFGQLIIGDNIIVIEVIDSYGAKTSKTIKLNKKAIETPLLESTQRYQLLPPSGSTVGVLFYIQREAALDMDVSISMTQEAEAEQYTTLKPVTTAPISQGSGIVEDEYYYAAPEPAEKILLQIDFTRTSLTTNEKIYVVMGAFE